MSRVVRSLFGVVAAAILVGYGSGMAQAEPRAGTGAGAAKGVVLVFEHEFTSTTRFVNPSGCIKLPPLAHVLTNQTDAFVRVYADPLCLTPSIVVPPGSGSHLAPLSASFKA
ncbi:hypothetical protein [Actinophytocola sp.]|uniref:hypothetical protein n=1 Tax=Actinophytocola sp. TaxID=1872138 RepID=UPI003D6AE27E